MPAIASWSHVSKRLGSTQALQDFSLDVHAGEVVAVLGPNGAGKTTALHLLLGLLAPDAGTVAVEGRDPRDAGARAAVGAVLQTAGFPRRLRVVELLRQHASCYAGARDVAAVLDVVGLGDRAQRRIADLSGGERRRVEFALALVGNPRLLLLDEPTVGVDPRERRALLDTIGALRGAGTAIVLTTHHLDEAERLADRIALLQQGRLRQVGTQATVKAAAGLRAARLLLASTLTDAALASLPAVAGVARREDRVEIHSSDGDTTLRALLAADAGAHDIEVRRASLEDAYLGLTEGAAA
ncbi:MAG: ABC transporter ATP-binding protein [Xanthomonadaceae bacterium]|jgi:ABC-2 type transport system ATP-binding protein|nr:ABC transporter ATP-binding protein [Xanthomonadaceae bacterium]